VMDSINLGQPLVQADPSSKITVEIKRIAGLVSGVNGNSSATPPRKGLLGNMFGRQSQTSPLDLSKMVSESS